MPSTNALPPPDTRALSALNTVVILAVIGISMQLFSVTYPPLVDLPNHLARHAIQCGGAYGENYARYYNFDLKAVPNLFADLVYWFDAPCSDVFLTNRVLIQVMVLNLVASVYALHFVLWRRVSVWPAASALLAYNASFTYGFENYVLTAPFALYLFALWVLLSDKKSQLRLAIVVPLSFGLYFLHIIAFGFFALLIAGWEIGRAAKLRSGWRRFLLRASGTCLLFLPALIHFILLNANSPMGNSVSRFSVLARIDAIFSPIMPRVRSLLSIGDLILPLVVFVILAVLIYAGLRGKKLQVSGRMRWAIGITLLSALLAPATLANVAFVHIRYPYLVAAVFIAASRWRLSLRNEALLAVVIIAAFAGRTYETKQEWMMHDGEVRELLTTAKALPAGAWLLPARSELSDSLIRHSHSVSYLGMYYPIFAPNLFNGANPLTPKPAVQNYVATQMFPWGIDGMLTDVETYDWQDNTQDSVSEKWQGWQARFTHYVVLGKPPIDPSSLPEGVTVWRTGSFFTILQNDRALAGG